MRWIRGQPEGGNEGSRFLEIALGDQRVLLTGDAEADGLRKALTEGWLEGPLRLLVFPHHGSETPLLGSLLHALQPEEVWVSSAREPPIARELARRRLPLRWTGRDRDLALFLPPER